MKHYDEYKTDLIKTMSFRWNRAYTQWVNCPQASNSNGDTIKIDIDPYENIDPDIKKTIKLIFDSENDK